MKSFKKISEKIDEALNRRERAEAKSLIKQANVFNRNMDKVEKFAFKNTRDLSKVERSLGGMIADLKRGFSMNPRFVNRQIEKIVGNDRFSNFKELADEAYEEMVSAEAAFEEHVKQLKDNDPDAQETLDIFLDTMQSANRSYSEFLRMAVVALKDKLNEAVHEAIREDQETNLDNLVVTAAQLGYAASRVRNIRRDRRQEIKRAKLAFKRAKVELDQAKNKGEVKNAKSELLKAVLDFDNKATPNEIRQLKQDIRRAKAERKAEVIRAKEALEQAKIDFRSAKDKTELRQAKEDLKLAQEFYDQQVFKAESYNPLDEEVSKLNEAV